MDIKLDQKLTAVYMALGAAAGVLANWLAEGGMLPYAFLAPLAIYAATVAVLARLAKGQKASKLVSGSLMTFVLVWAVVWVFLFNI